MTQVKEVTKDNLEDFKHLHDCIFPVKFPASFFRDIFKSNENINKLAILDERTVGALSARIIETDNKGQGLYITSLGCRLNYRRLGIGSILLEEAIKFARIRDCGQVFLHMQEGNEAIEFYTKHGFEIEKRVPNYYRRIEPSSALVLYKLL